MNEHFLGKSPTTTFLKPEDKRIVNIASSCLRFINEKSVKLALDKLSSNTAHVVGLHAKLNLNIIVTLHICGYHFPKGERKTAKGENTT